MNASALAADDCFDVLETLVAESLGSAWEAPVETRARTEEMLEKIALALPEPFDKRSDEQRQREAWGKSSESREGLQSALEAIRG
jgi:hypothetical protein